MKDNKSQYELFCEWLRDCPVEITNFQDCYRNACFTDHFNVTIRVPLEEVD